MNPTTAIQFLRSIDFPADPIESHEFAATDALLNTDPFHTIPLAIAALFPNRTLADLSDSDFDALDDCLYPNPD